MIRVRCGGPELPEYAVGRLPVERTRAWDRHLVTCQHCVVAVSQERRLQVRLSSGPAVSRNLHAQLLAMACRELGGPESARGVPRPAASMAPLPLMAPSAPPAHRSILRSVVLASTVAGLGATAVWTLGVAVRTNPTSQDVHPAAVLHTAKPVAPGANSPLTDRRSTVLPASWTGAGVPVLHPDNDSIDRAESTP